MHAATGPARSARRSHSLFLHQSHSASVHQRCTVWLCVVVCGCASLVQVLSWSPSTWASDYRGQWVDTLTLLVTTTSVPVAVRSDPSARSAVAVGALQVTVKLSGELTSLDGTSAASNASTIVSAGSWGDIVCDGGVVVYSHTALVVAFEPPANASYVPASYTIQVATAASFPLDDPSTRTVAALPGGSATATVALPLPLSATALRYIVPGLTTGTPYFVRVRAAPPELPADVTLPRPVPGVFRYDMVQLSAFLGHLVRLRGGVKGGVPGVCVYRFVCGSWCPDARTCSSKLGHSWQYNTPAAQQLVRVYLYSSSQQWK
jgi:hypothetical protein